MLELIYGQSYQKQLEDVVCMVPDRCLCQVGYVMWYLEHVNTSWDMYHLATW